MSALLESLKNVDMGAYLTALLASGSGMWMGAFVVSMVIIVGLLLKLIASMKKGGDLAAQLAEQSTELAVLNERLTAKSDEIVRAGQLHLKQVRNLENDLVQTRDKLETLRQISDGLRRNAAAMASSHREQQRAADEKLALLGESEQRLKESFENLANRIFDAKQEKFQEVSRQGVESLLDPVRQQLQDFRQRVEQVYDRESEQRTTLRAEITQLKSLNERISEDALNLTSALKGDSKLRGNWGEVQLERLLEESGLMRGREYDLQVSLQNETGRRMQPDAIVHLPDRKDVIIDSKVSLVAYEGFHSATDEDAKARSLKQHIHALRTHIRDLSGKDYHELVGVRSLDLVILFVPIEPALLLALEHDPGLYQEAFDQGVVLVSPTLLMTTLQIIQNIWRHEHQNTNAVLIATEAGRLYDQFVLFAESLDSVGDHIHKAAESYQQARNRLVEGRGNLVGRTEKMKQLGAKAKKSMPAALLEDAESAGEKQSGAGESRLDLLRSERSK